MTPHRCIIRDISRRAQNSASQFDVDELTRLDDRLEKPLIDKLPRRARTQDWHLSCPRPPASTAEPFVSYRNHLQTTGLVEYVISQAESTLPA
jgi:hypothetical protein